MQPLAGLDLDDDSVVDDHVERLLRERLAAVVDHHTDLSGDMMSLGFEIALECEGIDMLSKPKA